MRRHTDLLAKKGFFRALSPTKCPENSWFALPIPVNNLHYLLEWVYSPKLNKPRLVVPDIWQFLHCTKEEQVPDSNELHGISLFSVSRFLANAIKIAW